MARYFEGVGVVVRIAFWLSLATLGVFVLGGVWAVDELNEPWFGEEPGDVSLWWGVLFGLAYSVVVLAFIWLGVFVAYVITLAVRYLR